MDTVYTAEVDSPVGALRLASTEDGLVYVELPRASGRGFAGWLERHALGAAQREAYAPNRVAAAQICEYLEGKRLEFDLPLDLRATDFQKRVYGAIAAIPYGETRSYAEVASQLGRANAVRAVGAASGANPVPLVIPCHRVIAKDGHLQGYAGGVRLKGRLLAMERARPGQGRLL
ncbi:MAG: methylated-DNA--[protein]-cysteine S-methyltransferase [Proteobacteria bacterium]|nr:methylated-DNA--[protein]-cysteine S-methyltransferase [Pseudomonadota bacterium]MCZ6782849.1 methylated-DNA--[protein]-cysteine S-methyltransferase [Pseudomonadota bacterium]